VLQATWPCLSFYLRDRQIALHTQLIYYWVMKTSLHHLPENKQQELQRAVDIICTSIHPEMLILFGSYARGNWVEELGADGFYYKYQSDFDFLIVTTTPRQAMKVETNGSLWNQLSHRSKTPVSIIAHDIEFFNRRIRKGQYFFSDIKKEGILLYNSEKFQLAETRELSAKERKNIAQSDFEYWFDSAKEFILDFRSCLNRKNYTKAAFELHQAVERFYSTILLVFTHYKPSTHDLEKLSKRVASFESQFLSVFPTATEEEKLRFQLLRKAYVDARYKPSYSITQQQLEWLADRVEHLQQLTETLCKQKIDSFYNEED
jgi:HEPN domain-containing protein/predicted nucleotidyltransferase